MLILLLLKIQAFNPAAAEALVSAFDTVWNVLRRLCRTLAADDLAITTREGFASRQDAQKWIE
jgi:hypothetical protein